MGWNTSKLGYVCEMIKRGVSPKYIESGGICVINQKCIRDHEVNYSLARRHDLDAKKVNEERYIKVGDVLVNSTGTGTLGRVAQIRTTPPEQTTVDTHVTIVRPKPDLFYDDFFGYMLIKIEEEITAAGEGASGQTELARTKLENEFFVSYPDSIPEQKRIVAILDQAFSDIEQARAKTEQNLKNARELMNVAFHDAITGKLTSVWRENNQKVVTASELLKQLKAQKKDLVNEKKISKEKVLPELSKEKVSYDLPESWVWCSLGEIGNATNYPFVDGPFGSSINTKTDYLETGVPVLRMANVKPFVFKNYNLKYVAEDKYQQFTRHNVLPGDVLFSKVGAGTGESCVVPEDFSYGMLSTTGITRIRVGQIVLNQYLCCFLNLNIKKFMVLASKAAQPFLNMTQIKTFPFPLPPIEEQSEIVIILERLSVEIQQVEAIYQQKILALDELKKSILQKAFTGELTKQKEGVAA